MAKFNVKYQCATDQYCGRTDAPSNTDLEIQRSTKFTNNPKFSIVVPLYNTPIEYLLECVGSVLAQTYPNWELILVNASPKNELLNEALNEYEKQDSRIHNLIQERNEGIVGNTNKGINYATGDYLAFLDHDDKLEPDALYLYAKEINEHPDTDMLYCDEDLFRADQYFGPLIKPEFNIDLLRSQNYIVHFLCVKRQLLLLAGLSPNYVEGAQDYDASFKVAEKAARVARIPHVLYHWRSHAKSISADPTSKSYSEESGRLAIKDHLTRTCPGAQVTTSKLTNVYNVTFPINKKPRVFLLNLKDKISSGESYSTHTSTNSAIDLLQFTSDKYLLANNIETSDFILVTNECTPCADALDSMLKICSRHDVGAVGAKVFNHDRKLVSAGAKYQFDRISKNPLIKMFSGLGEGDLGYEDRVAKMHDLSVLTDVALIKSNIFAVVDGLDTRYESGEFRIADAMLRINQEGYLVVYDPSASFYTINSDTAFWSDEVYKKDEFLFIDKWKNKMPPVDKIDNPQFMPTSPYCALRNSQFVKTTIERIYRKLKGVK